MDSRSTIVFGNGLGMALDADYFKLEAGLDHVWNRSEHLTPEHKQLIQSTLHTVSEESGPQSEKQLDELQLALFAASTLGQYDDKNASTQKWLQDRARDIPIAFKKYIHQVGIYFHGWSKRLEGAFVESLAKYLEKSYSHVATLNYDSLLYDALVDKKVLCGYRCLVDGYNNKKFEAKNLDRRDPKRLGWFLHLHGSPLFIDDQKIGRENRREITVTDQCHIVLTHIMHKPTIISESVILSEYFSRFYTALKESARIILFGYSGKDDHLNKLVASALQEDDKKLLIVEWDGEGSEDERKDFWNEKLNVLDAKRHISIKLMPNILSFSDWDSDT